MHFGLMVIAALIANLHAAVFYVFFILLMPYFAEYIIVVLSDAYPIKRFRINSLKRKIERLTRKEAAPEEITKIQDKLMMLEDKLQRFKTNSIKRRENPYKIKLVKKDAVKWLFIIAILCFAMGLLTPIGDEPYTHLFKLLSGNTTKSISEHQPMILYYHIPAIIVLTIMLSMLIFTDTKIRLKDLFMLGGLTTLSFIAQRQFSLLLIIGVMSIGTLICEFVNKYDTKRNKRIYQTYDDMER